MILEGDRATGVKVVPTKPLHPGAEEGRIYKARKFVIVSGGTLSSPLILQRSGIGDPAKLRKAGVKPLVDLPGVGLNFQDHCKFCVAATSTESLLTVPRPHLRHLPRQATCRVVR